MRFFQTMAIAITAITLAACGGTQRSTAPAPSQATVQTQPTAAPAQPTAVPAQPTAVPPAPTAVPPSPPPPAPTAAPAGGGGVPGNPGSGINMVGALNDGRSFDARTTQVNAQLGFPPYKDTGIAKSANYDFVLPSGWSVTIGGVTVDYAGIRHDKVALIALQGPVEVHTWIFEGFYQALPNDQIQGDFCARAKWHKDTNKMWSFIQPLPSWGPTPCPGVF